MAKADPARNYYADLGVAANAGENEIRKAFRSLALQYHPDRNPGREQEVVTKFQEIQAAHEVLADPAQRAKYDNERRKYRNTHIPAATPNTPRARPPPRHAYTTTTPSGSYYRPPPPKPTPQAAHPPPPQPRPPPQQHHSTYSSGADRFSGRNFRPPPTAQRPDARRDSQDKANVFTAWQKMKTPRAEEPRPAPQPRPYNPNGAPFGRSQSTRMPSSRTGFDPGTPGADEGQARSAYRSNYTRPPPTPPGGTESDAPYSEGNRTRTPYSSAMPGERTSMFEGTGRSASVRNSPTHAHRPTSSQDAGFYSDSGRRQQRNSTGARPPRQPIPQMYPDSSDDESEGEVFRVPNRPRAVPKAPRPPQPQPQPQPQPSQAQPAPPSWGPAVFSTPQPTRQSNAAPGTTPTSFKSRSEENINIQFSPSDWHGQFGTGTGNDYFAPNNMQKTAKNNKGRASPTRGRATSQRATSERHPFLSHPMAQPSNVHSEHTFKTQFGHIPPPPPGPPPKAAFPPPPDPAPHTATFSPDAWQETFKEPSWAYPTTKETSPRRASEATKRPKAGRKTSVPQPKAQTQTDASRPKYQAFAEEATNGDADAMDIDSDLSPDSTDSAAKPRSAASSAKEKTNGTSAVPHATDTSTNTADATKRPTSGLGGLADLANVEPLLPPQNGGGLSGLDALKDTLPFQSQASTTHPTKPSTARSLKFPTVPVAPHAPTKLDQPSTDLYFSQMEAYARAYNTFSRDITAHFAARSAELESLDTHFIRSRGETTSKLGFASYLNRMREDEGVMTLWKVAQERHLAALEACEEVRNKTTKMYQ